MSKERKITTSFTLSRELLKKARAKAKETHGERGFSDYLRSLILADLEPKDSGSTSCPSPTK
jgi:hypothetical protein